MRFLVAKNPDPDSRLPFLLKLPIDGGLVLKARDRWPATSRVFCAPAEEWPAEAEILEEVDVASCRRRGIAIDLVLERPRENRSQFIETITPAGHPAIFWQTRKVVGTARPGARIPGRRASGIPELVILVDTREKYPFTFTRQQASTERMALPAGDYAVREGGRIIAAVERKALGDLSSSLNNGTFTFELGRLSELPRAAVIVEDRYSALVKQPYAPAGFLPDLLARVQVRYPDVAIVFGETRPLAEEWTFRYLGAALAEHLGLTGGEPNPRQPRSATKAAASTARRRAPVTAE